MQLLTYFLSCVVIFIKILKTLLILQALGLRFLKG
jgi:hypothetical protein